MPWPGCSSEVYHLWNSYLSLVVTLMAHITEVSDNGDNWETPRGTAAPALQLIVLD